jgi:glycosyltransferase involved in cell wall biosynthesis
VDNRDTIAVVVPFLNERDNLTYLLDQLASQMLAADEVILVDSGSTDGSPKLIENWIAAHGKQSVFRVHQAGTTTPGGSKTAGVRATSCDLLAFMDCGLSFPQDWLYRQYEMLVRVRADWVSGVCLTLGTTLVDKSAIAHTYGYGSSGAPIPSSLVRRSVFKTIGLFKDLRAGYDAEWMRAAQRAGLRRVVNHDVIVAYRSTNFATNLRGVFLKSVRYARASVGRDDTITPFVYVGLPVAGVLIELTAPGLLWIGLLSYATARLWVACQKSRRIGYFAINPLRLIVLIAVGAVLDLGKLCGSASGLYIRYCKRQTLTISSTKHHHY